MSLEEVAEPMVLRVLALMVGEARISGEAGKEEVLAVLELEVGEREEQGEGEDPPSRRECSWPARQ